MTGRSQRSGGYVGPYAVFTPDELREIRRKLLLPSRTDFTLAQIVRKIDHALGAPDAFTKPLGDRE